VEIKEVAVTVKVENGVLTCLIPLNDHENNVMRAKMIAYGALKLAEEQASIYFMRQAMQREALMRSGIIKPGN
jgi:hypothetical protein